MADAFFDRFANQVAPPAPAEPEAVAAGALAPAPAAAPAAISLIPAAPLGLPLLTWVGFVIFFVILVLIGGSFLS
jgi:hypothetical protein